jgi:hypothetical protein
MSIIREGLCGACAAAAKGKTGEGKAAALAEVRERVASGKLRGPQIFAPRNKKAKEIQESLKKTRKRVVDVLGGKSPEEPYQKPEERLGPEGAAPHLYCVIRHAPQAKSTEPVIIQIRFAGNDLALYGEFQSYCRQKRRDMEGQILFLIENIVRTHQQLQRESGDPS